ncbi:KGGVGR-motif variant AAA ATPase [Actinoplanes sp. RD1]|uniref:KGGVGR-motif variant AAA ATPase n=1 Tax=Actinoplanes sp. RD1 TaxID=3064538 RepID=UPI00274052D8|nr:TIR domain-containing protein [Actinoplanes sp. RD1]
MAGRIITFYSYRGGVGRTMALVNTAWLLAGAGYRVLVMDWDLEAPSLHNHLHPFLRDSNLRRTTGLLDLILGSATGPTPLWTSAVAIDWEFPEGGIIDLVPAGLQDAGYAQSASEMDWDALWQSERGRGFLDDLRTQMVDHYDFALLDSATGTAAAAGIATIHMPDAVIILFGLSRGGITGTAAVANSIRRQEPGISIFPVPAMLSADRADAVSVNPEGPVRRMLDGVLTGTGVPDVADYWRSMAVPYDPEYAYGEVLASFVEPKVRPGSVLAAYSRLAEAIAGHPVPMAAVDDAARTKVLAEFRAFSAGTQPRSRVFLSYIRDDAVPVDRIAAELRRVGVDVWMDRTHLRPGQRWADVIRNEISERDFFIACFSTSYTNRSSTYMNEELQQAIEQIRRRPRELSWFIPAKLDDCTVPAVPVGGGDTLRDFQSVDFAADWEGALEALTLVLINAR